MNKVTKAAAHATFATVETTARLAEVGDGAELAVDGPGGVPAAIQIIAGLLRRLLVLEARIDVADQMVVVVVADDQLLELAVLAHLAPDVLVEGVKVILQLRGVHAVLGVEGGVLVQVRHQDRLAVGRLDVFSRATVAVAAGADLVVEGAIHLFRLWLRARAGKVSRVLLTKGSPTKGLTLGREGGRKHVPCPAPFRKY